MARGRRSDVRPAPVRNVEVAQENSEPVLRTRSDAEVLAVRRSSVSVDVSAVAPAGCKRIAADLFVPQSVRSTPLLWVCIPGGGMSRQYFDLDVAGQTVRSAWPVILRQAAISS